MPAPSKSFTTFADSAVDPDSPIDTALMTGNRDNDIHLQEVLYFGYTPAQAHNHDGVNSALVASVAAGAIGTTQLASAAVTQAKIASGAVGQAQLKTNTASGSLGNVGTQQSIQSSSGGAYGFSILTGYTDNAGSPPQAGAFWGRAAAFPWDLEQPGNTSLAVGAYITLAVIGHQVDYTQIYVTTSPPYDLGDGPVHGFIFVEIDSAGAVVQTWTSQDPPWANNGPTDLRPDCYARDGTGLKLLPEILAEHGSIAAAIAAGMSCRQAIQRLRTDSLTVTEITQALKQADMPTIPHPFHKPVNPANTIALLDPMDDDVVAGLHELHPLQPQLVAQLLHRGDIRVDNTVLKRNGPPGVMVCAAKWKLTS
jgi:hypothetical protein